MNKEQRERIKQRAAELKAEAAGNSGTTVAVAEKPPEKPISMAQKPVSAPIPRKGGEPISYRSETHACGHTGPFPILVRDKYEQQRLAKFQRKQCPECSAKTAAEHNARDQAAAKTRREQREQRPQTPKTPSPDGRLPHGALFVCGPYDAVAISWTVVLTIPGLEPMIATGSSLEHTQRGLYARWLEMQTKSATDLAASETEA